MPQKSSKSNKNTELSLPKVDRQLAKTLRTIEKQIKQTTKAIKAQDKIAKQNARTIKTITKANKQMAKSSEQVAKKQAKMMKNLVKSTSRMKEQRRQVQQNIKTNRSFADSFLKIAAVAAVAFAAIRKIGQIADTKINVSILAPNLIKQIRQIRGQVTDAQLELLNSVLGQSPATQFGIGRSPQAIEGLLKLQDKTIGLGRDNSQRLIEQVQRSFGANVARQQKFFESLGKSDDVQAVIREFSTVQNFQSFDSLLNAIQTQRDAAEGKADPLIQAAVKNKQAAEALRKSFEVAADKIADTLSPAITSAAESIVKAAEKFNTSDISGTELLIGGGLLAGLALGGGPALLRGGGRLLGRVAGKGLGRLTGRAVAGRAAPSIIGQAIPTIEGFGARRAAQTTAGRVGASIVARGLAAAATVAKGITAVSVGSAALIGAPVAIGGAILRKPIKDREQFLEQNARLEQRNEQSRSTLAGLAKERQQNATLEIDRLRGKRLEIDTRIMGADPEGRNIEILREMRIKVVAEIERLRDKAPQTPATNDATKKAAKSAKELAKAMQQATDQIKRNTESSRLESLRQAAIAQQTLQLTIRERGSFTTIARQELEFAKLSPFSILGAIPELENLTRVIEKEIGKLRELLATIDESETEGIIKANEIRGSINRLRIESKQQNIHLRRAMLDNVLGDAFNSGIFSKQLVRSGPLGVAQGIGQGLRQGIIGKNIPTFVTGSLTPQFNMPIFPRDFFPNLPTLPPSPQPQLPKRPRPRFDPTAPPRAFTPPSPRQANIPQPQANAPQPQQNPPRYVIVEPPTVTVDVQPPPPAVGSTVELPIPFAPEPRVVLPEPRNIPQPQSKAELSILKTIESREKRIDNLFEKREIIRESESPTFETLDRVDRQIERAEQNNRKDRQRIIKILNRIAQGFGQAPQLQAPPAVEAPPPPLLEGPPPPPPPQEPRVIMPPRPQSKAELRILTHISEREQRIDSLIAKQEIIRHTAMPDQEQIGKIDRQIQRAEQNNRKDRERIITIVNRIAQGFGSQKEFPMPTLSTVEIPRVDMPTIPESIVKLPDVSIPELPEGPPLPESMKMPPIKIPDMPELLEGPPLPEMQLPTIPDLPTMPTIPEMQLPTIPDLPTMKMPEIPEFIAKPPQVKIPELPEVELEGPPIEKMPKLPRIPLFIFGEELEAARDKRDRLREQERELVTMGTKTPQANKKRATKPASRETASEQMKVVAATVLDVVPILREMESHIDLIGPPEELKPERIPLNRGGTNVNQ